MPRKQIKKIK